MWSAGRGSTEAGFTLLELMVVMVIIGLMALLALPMLSRSLDTVRLDGAARQLAAAGRKARSDAMVSRAPRWLVIDAAAERFWLSNEPKEENDSGQGGAVKTPSIVDIKGFAGMDGKVVEKIAMVRFDPNGSSSGGTVRMERRDAGRVQKVREVFFEPFTGLPSIIKDAAAEDGKW